MADPVAFRWIRTDCGRAKYLMLAQRPGLAAWLRLVWFVLIAALRDWRLPQPPPSSPDQGAQSAGGS